MKDVYQWLNQTCDTPVWLAITIILVLIVFIILLLTTVIKKVDLRVVNFHLESEVTRYKEKLEQKNNLLGRLRDSNKKKEELLERKETLLQGCQQVLKGYKLQDKPAQESRQVPIHQIATKIEEDRKKAKIGKSSPSRKKEGGSFQSGLSKDSPVEQMPINKVRSSGNGPQYRGDSDDS